MTSVAHNKVMRHSIDGSNPRLRSREPASPPFRQSRAESCCSDADRIAPIVASIKGRANWGLQASSLLNRFILRLNLGRDARLRTLVVVDEEVVDVEVSELGVVASQIIIFKIEVVGEREDPVLKECMI